MTILRIDPAIELDTTRGRGYSHFLLDYGDGRDTLWQVFLRESGESWWCPNRDVLHPPCWSLGVRRAECSVGSSPTDPGTEGTDEEWTSEDEITERALVLANKRESDLWEHLQSLTVTHNLECEHSRHLMTTLQELQGELTKVRGALSHWERRYDEECQHSRNLSTLLEEAQRQVKMWRDRAGVDPATGLHEPPAETPGGVPQPAAPPAAPTLAAAPLAAAGGPLQPCSAAVEPAPAPTLTAAPPANWSHSGYRWVRDPDRDQS